MIKLQDILLEVSHNKIILQPEGLAALYRWVRLPYSISLIDCISVLIKSLKRTAYIPNTIKLYRSVDIDTIDVNDNYIPESTSTNWSSDIGVARRFAQRTSGNLIILYIPKEGEIILNTQDVNFRKSLDLINKVSPGWFSEWSGRNGILSIVDYINDEKEVFVKLLTDSIKVKIIQ